MSSISINRRAVPALLVTEDGRAFAGQSFGAEGETFGEIVFNTGMTGYQETLTDPSYRRQIVVMTAPHIGNTGVNDEDDESDDIWVAGFVVRDPTPVTSNWRATGSLADRLAEAGIVGISGIDTRALTRHVRERGAMRCAISTVELDADVLTERTLAAPKMEGADLSGEVTTIEPYVVDAEGEQRFRVAVIDLGLKRNTPREMSRRGAQVHVFGAKATIDDILAIEPDGVFFSNGPGDPATADHQVELAREVLRRKLPLFGICFGNQILGRALGFGTYKLRYGHRGINQPVLDRTTGKTEITAHNHGFAVDAPVPIKGEPYEPVSTEFGRVEVSHVCLNDNVVEGLRCLDAPAFSVQYHPEAAAGPHDASYLFDRFADLMAENRKAGSDHA